MAVSIAASVCTVAAGVGAARTTAGIRSRMGIERCSCFRSSFVAPKVGLKSSLGKSLGPQNGSMVNAWFKFGKNGLDSEGAGIYGSQGRDDFDRDDVEQYFNYMGMLATEGTYDKLEALLSTGTHPVDILLLLAASEGDVPKIEELLRAGADPTVKDDKGRTALDRAADEDIKNLISTKSTIKV
ncbi:hypothetical protein R1sor_007170 [Riccia sorocarpa]|uniref:Protein LHCP TRANSLOCATION DEFECT n=1 Tax=Riccia sorocarpa TaxID=122646 RepID=A0ABD3HSF1_9MARC